MFPPPASQLSKADSSQTTAITQGSLSRSSQSEGFLPEKGKISAFVILPPSYLLLRLSQDSVVKGPGAFQSAPVGETEALPWMWEAKNTGSGGDGLIRKRKLR